MARIGGTVPPVKGTYIYGWSSWLGEPIVVKYMVRMSEHLIPVDLTSFLSWMIPL